MSTVRQLTKEDVLFVAGETDTVYQHTAGLVILDASAAPDFNFETFIVTFMLSISGYEGIFSAVKIVQQALMQWQTRS